MGILDGIRRLVGGKEEVAFAIPQGQQAVAVRVVDPRPLRKAGAQGTTSLVVTSRPGRIKDPATGSVVSSADEGAYVVLAGRKPCGLVPIDAVGPVMSRFDEVGLTALVDGSEMQVSALLPNAVWFEAAGAGILDLPADAQVVRAYIADDDWHGAGGAVPSVVTLEPLDVELVGGAHDVTGGQLMNFFCGDERLVGTLPNKSYSFQRLRRMYPDGILAATAEEFATPKNGFDHCINVYVRA